MTSSVIVRAHCPENIEVVALVHLSGTSTQEFVLNNGEEKEWPVFDSRIVEVFERKKA